MRDAGPIVRKMTQTAKLKYERIARTVLGQLRKRIEKLGLTTGKVKRTLKDGTEIIAWVLPTSAGQQPLRIVRVRVTPTPGFGYETYYMDTGFITYGAYGDGPPVFANEAYMEQNARTLVLYGTNDAIFAQVALKRLLLEPLLADAINADHPLALGHGGITPVTTDMIARLYQKTNQFFVDGTGPGVNSGKLKLYSQAKLGRKLTLYGSEDGGTSNTWAPRKDCTGLVTDSNGDYWLAQVSWTNAEVTFKKLLISSTLTNTRDTYTPGSYEYLWVEAYCLCHSRVSTEDVYTAPISVTGGFTTGDPIAYSWNFNWDGSEAVMVTHFCFGQDQTTNPPIKAIRTQIWKLNITVNPDVTPPSFNVAASYTDEGEWTYSLGNGYDIWWKPSLIVGAPGLCPVSFGSQAPYPAPYYDSASDVAVYAYYQASSGYRNNTLGVVRYTRESGVITDPIISGNYDGAPGTALSNLIGYCGGELQYINGSRETGSYRRYSVSMSGGSQTATADHYSSYNQREVINITTNRQFGGDQTVGGSAVAWATSEPGVSASGKLSCDTTTYNISFPPGVGDTGVIVEYEEYTWAPSFEYWNLNNFGASNLPHMGLVWLFGCAEGFLVASSENYHLTGSAYFFFPETAQTAERVATDAYGNNSKQPAIITPPDNIFGQYYRFNNRDSLDPGDPGYVPPYTGQVWRGVGKIQFWGRDYSRSYGLESEQYNSTSAQQSLVAETYASYDELDPCNYLVPTLVEGFGPESLAVGAADNISQGGFPSYFTDQTRVSVMGAL